jgi:DNA-directed RNA polymerase specialized sigma24 family protein
MLKPTAIDSEADPGSSGALQQLDESLLADFAQTPEAERLARLEADKELLLQLMVRGYEGEEWTRFARALAEYGVQVIRAWVHSGKIFGECKAHGFGGLPVRRRSHDDAHELALETVAVSINSYRESVLMPGKWDATKGASLKTFFVGQCLRRFPNVYRRWIADSFDPLSEVGSAPTDNVSARHRPSLAHPIPLEAPQPSSDILTELRRELATLSHDSPRIMEAALVAGYEQSEVAKELGLTLRAVEARLHRHRKAKQAR